MYASFLQFWATPFLKHILLRDVNVSNRKMLRGASRCSSEEQGRRSKSAES